MTGIIGAVIGDIIGCHFEQTKPTKDYNFNLFNEKMHFTDDTTCTIAVADWLMNTKRTPKELVAKLKYWCRKYNFGFADRFNNWVNSEKTAPYYSFGNGSAMRVSPVAWVAKSLQECINLAKISAEVTHNHPEGVKGAIAIAVAIYLNRTGKSKQEIIKFIESNSDYKIPQYENLYNTHKMAPTCQVSVPASICCWNESTSYEDCIRKAISLGGDADTEACIAGSICNANPATQVSNELIKEIIDRELIPSDIFEIIKNFHRKYES